MVTAAKQADEGEQQSQWRAVFQSGGALCGTVPVQWVEKEAVQDTGKANLSSFIQETGRKMGGID